MVAHRGGGVEVEVLRAPGRGLRARHLLDAAMRTHYELGLGLGLGFRTN